MEREKRKLYQEKPSKPIWPWLLGGVLVMVLLITGIGLGMLLSGGHKDAPEPVGPIVKNAGADTNPVIEKPPKDEGKGKDKGTPPKPKAKPELYEFIVKNRVYLVLTTGGRHVFTDKDSVLNEDSHLGAFFKAIKAHYKDNSVKRNPNMFEAATYEIGPDPAKLTGETPIPYIPNGGTEARPVHYDLRQMTVLAARSRHDPSKQAGIYFQFPKSDKGQWVHIQGKGIEPFYLVPLETGQYPALVTLNVADGIAFDDQAMTAKVKPQITEAIKKLLKENKALTKIMLRAGAPLATWGLAHKNGGETIDFKMAHLEPQKTVARLMANNLKGENLTHFEKWTFDAIRYYFPTAQAVAEAKKRNDLPKVLEKTAAYAEMSMRYVKGGSPILGLDDHKAALTRDAVAIMQGRMTVGAAKKSWEAKMKKMKNTDVNAATAKWDDKKHQQAEWERFKKHQVFYLGGTIEGTVLSLVQFSQ